MRKIFLTTVLLVASVGFSGCASYVENQASYAFKPIYPEAQLTPDKPTPNGGIYTPVKGGLFATDRRATAVGDILTVNFQESFNASKSQSATSTKTDNFDLTLPIGLPNAVTGGFGAGQLTSGTARNFNGAGTAAQSNSLTGLLSVTVTRVFENGNMEIRGQKKLSLNNGDEYVRVTGLVRPQDITAANVVQSSRIADAQIVYVGAGEVADSSRQGWLSRTLRTISPF
jgi:flagellar L-ring protein precursor FlgH